MRAHKIGLGLLVAMAILVFAGQANASYTRTLFSDDFNDGNYNGWTVEWGTHSVVSGALRTVNGLIVSGDNRWRTQVYTAKMRTVTPGGATTYVGWMGFRYADVNNGYYLALRTDGYLDLSKKQGGTWYGTIKSQSIGLSPTVWHTFVIKAEGARITVWVDGVQRFTYDDPNPILTGKIGFLSVNATAELDDVVVTHEQQALAIYHGWYGDASQGWLHWGSSPLGYSTWHVPKLGFYSSTSQTIVDTHADWAVAAGIDGFICDWWHLSGWITHHEACYDKMIAACNTRGKKFCMILETEYEATPEAQINYLKGRYAGNAAYLYKAGKPVFFIWETLALAHTSAYWATVRQNTGAYIVLYTWTQPFTAAACDAMTLWMITTDGYIGDASLTGFYNNLNTNHGGAYCLPVHPGCDNNLTMNPTWWSIVGRSNSARYALQWTRVLNNLTSQSNFPGYHPDIITIPTWNDWNETASIEPCDGTRPIISGHDGDWGFEYLQKTAAALGVTWVQPADGSNFYDTFATNTGKWSYAGNAYRDTTNNYVVLTQNVNGQGSAIWFNTSKTNTNMTIQFRYKAGGGTGAEGMCVMFYKNKNYTPAAEGNIGFQGVEPNFQGYGIEIDNYNNGAWNNDPSANHFAIIKDFVSNHLLYYNDARTEDNQWHTMKVVIAASTITVYVDNMTTPIMTYSGTISRTYGWIGFGAGTGWSYNNWHIIDDVYIAWS